MFRPKFVIAFGFTLLVARSAIAEVPVQRTFFRLASTNGHGAVLLDLQQKRATHFREHLYAAEEPLLDASGQEVWIGNQPQAVASRDLLYDAYFGLRANGDQQWLTGLPVDLDASGYAGFEPGARGGTGIATMVQSAGALRTTQFVFAPRGVPHAAFVMAIRVENTGSQPATGVSVFSIHNLHMGFGRPGVAADIGEQAETITFDGSAGKADFLERAFAGVVAARALGTVAHHAAWNAASTPAENAFAIVQAGGTTNLPDVNGELPAADGSVSAFQFDVGDLAPGADAWAGVAFVHHPDPFEAATAQDWLEAFVAGRSADAVVDAEIAGWADFQAALEVPRSLAAAEETLLRHSAVVLSMAQAEDQTAMLREVLTDDGTPRYTRFGETLGGPPASLPATIAHRARGQVIASLPPGEWTVSWIRDGAYATAAMATLGMRDQARNALSFYLGAEANRFQAWNELAPYAIPPYQISLVRYYGFGVEETDLNDFGPNLEFDGLGLFLWAARRYEDLTGDETLVDDAWDTISSRIADVLVALVDPATDLVRKDSSIWETHWNGRERAWTYTNITAVRGLCDASRLAERVGDDARAKTYRATANRIRDAIASKLTDGAGALASNTDELARGDGYWDASVLDAIAMGLFDPKGKIAKATLAGLDAHLTAPAGAGWSRNDDRTDHAGGEDSSPWGSEYDSAEWVVTDLRGAVATRLMGDDERSDRLLAWVRDQSHANYLAIAETYDEGNGTYKFNAPMVGFGAGVYALALAARAGIVDEPACGAYGEEHTGSSSSSAGGGGSGSSSEAGTGGLGSGGSGGTGGEFDGGGCDCRVDEGGSATGLLTALIGAIALIAARRRTG